MLKSRDPVKIAFKTEIGMALIIKALLLYLLWHLFFRAPVDEAISAADISRQYFSLDSVSSTQHKITPKGQP